MQFIVREVALRNYEAEELRQIATFTDRAEASEFARDCAYEELVYDGPFGSNAYVGPRGFEVQPYDDGPYYVCDIYDVVKGKLTEWHGKLHSVL